MSRCYLDHGTTTPVDPRVREAMLPFLGDRFGAPLGLHRRGREAREAVERARSSVAALLGAKPDEIVFVASATEANNLAIKGTALAAGGPGRFLAPATEHIATLHPLRSLARSGFDTVLLPVDRHGVLDPGTLRHALPGGALLVTLAQASQEIGTIQPIADLRRATRESGVPLHCDATTSAGLLPWADPGDLPDLITLTPHLFNGPQGIAALRVAAGHALRPIIEGGTQERGLRAGTLPLAAVVGFGVAAELAGTERLRRAAEARALAERFESLLRERIAGVVLTGHPANRLPGHVSLCVRGVEAEAVLHDLDGLGIEAASGSLCTTEIGKPSHVLTSIGIDPVLARGALVFMFGSGNGPGDPERAADALAQAVDRLRALSPFGAGD